MIGCSISTASASLMYAGNVGSPEPSRAPARLVYKSPRCRSRSPKRLSRSSSWEELSLKTGRNDFLKGDSWRQEEEEDPFEMTASQEVANAITMLFPVCVLGYYCWIKPHNLVATLLVAASMHLPASFTYHLSCAFRRYEKRLDNDMRRLDQSLQHIVGAFNSLALSGSLIYFLLNSAFNMYGVVQLWKPETSNDGKRWKLVMVSVLLYTAPMLWRGDNLNYFLALTSIGFGGISFVPAYNTTYFGGWGHSLFHTVLIVFAYALQDSARKLNVEDIGRFDQEHLYLRIIAG
mmetsp:Transcript_39618/g.61822  ORF Transcript_39618/g.61822 Transcript_39618/m.61822 type:complete len:291 (-) Transcript_39618:2549-3421(-)